MAESILAWMEEYIATESAVLGEAEVKTRIGALREMFRGYRSMNAQQFQEAMTTAHFSTYFGDALSRMFLQDYTYKVGDWKAYTYQDTAPDFRDVARYRMSEPGKLEKRREKDRSHATYIAPSRIAYGVDEFSRSFDVSWQAILNDDLGKIKETPSRMATAAARFEDEFVSALYDNATSQAALVALGASYAGTGKLTVPNLTTGINAMFTRTDALGNMMNIQKVHLVIPPVSVIAARTIVESLLLSGTPNNDKNLFRDFIAGVHVDPYMTYTADIPWYLFADPSDIPAVTVVRLQGVDGPWVYKKRSDVEMISGNAPAGFLLGDFDSGNVVYSVEDVVGGWDDASYVGVTDFRGIYYSTGAAA